ncbi:hypothetical protein SAMN02910368_00186 [Lachnospiraceae bacterium G11]|nr:hypothetical protein SAMN02910368_00186 [Lachnospiraceae bacterium G11]
MKKGLCFVLIFVIAFSWMIPSSTSKAAEEFITIDYSRDLDMTFDEMYDSGSLISQDDQFIYYNDESFGGLCAEDKDSGDKIKLTDYPVANINVHNNSLFFTDMEDSIGFDSSIAVDMYEQRFGGGLYRVDNLSSLKSGFNVKQIGSSNNSYYNLKYDDNGFYGLIMHDDETTEYVKLDDEGDVNGYISLGDGDTIVNSIELNGYLYLEVITDNAEDESYGGYILCVDRDGGSGKKTKVSGMNMHLVSGRIVFQSPIDFYLYAIEPGRDEAYVISFFAIRSFYKWGEFLVCIGEAPIGASFNMWISKDLCIEPFEYTSINPVNGWFNMIECFDFSIGITPPPPPPITETPEEDEQKGNPPTTKTPEEDDGGIDELPPVVFNPPPIVFDGPGCDWTIPEPQKPRIENPWAREYKPPRPETTPIDTKSEKPDYPEPSETTPIVDETPDPQDAVNECIDLWKYITDKGSTQNLKYNRLNGGIDKFVNYYGYVDWDQLMQTEEADLKSQVRSALNGYNLSEDQLQDIADILPEMIDTLLAKANPQVSFVEGSSDNKKAIVRVTTGIYFNTTLDTNQMYSILSGDWRSKAGLSAGDSQGTMLYKTFMYVMRQYKWCIEEARTDDFLVVYDEQTKHWRVPMSEANRMVDMLIHESWKPHNATLNMTVLIGDGGGLFAGGSASSSGSGSNQSNANTPKDDDDNYNPFAADPDIDDGFDKPGTLNALAFKRILVHGNAIASRKNKEAGYNYWDMHEEALAYLKRNYKDGQIIDALMDEDALDGFLALLGESGGRALKAELERLKESEKKDNEELMKKYPDSKWKYEMILDAYTSSIDHLIRKIENKDSETSALKKIGNNISEAYYKKLYPDKEVRDFGAINHAGAAIMNIIDQGNGKSLARNYVENEDKRWGVTRTFYDTRDKAFYLFSNEYRNAEKNSGK